MVSINPLEQISSARHVSKITLRMQSWQDDFHKPTQMFMGHSNQYPEHVSTNKNKNLHILTLKYFYVLLERNIRKLKAFFTICRIPTFFGLFPRFCWIYVSILLLVVTFCIGKKIETLYNKEYDSSYWLLLLKLWCKTRTK